MDALRDELVQEFNLLGEREDIIAESVEDKVRQNGKGEGTKGAAVVGTTNKRPKSVKQAKYAKPVKIDDVCWIKRECGHVVIKVCLR